jgi:putative flippase GtrA
MIAVVAAELGGGHGATIDGPAQGPLWTGWVAAQTSTEQPVIRSSRPARPQRRRRKAHDDRVMSLPLAWRDAHHRARIARLIRYGTVSIVSTTTSLVVLGVLVGGFAAPAAWSNVLATAVGTVPSFELNRRWVWGRRGRRSLAAEVVPFCVLSFSGLVLSTLAVHVAAGATANWSRAAHTTAVELANVAAFGSLWIVQFVLLDRVLFRTRDAKQPRPLGCADTERLGSGARSGLHADTGEADPRPVAARGAGPPRTDAVA